MTVITRFEDCVWGVFTGIFWFSKSLGPYITASHNQHHRLPKIKKGEEKTKYQELTKYLALKSFMESNLTAMLSKSDN